MRVLLWLTVLLTSQFATANLTAVDSSTVLIFVIDENNEFSGTGSGFFISNQGHLVTNHHVIEQGKAFGLIGAGIESEDPVLARVSGRADDWIWLC